jgi:hypothetical protein
MNEGPGIVKAGEIRGLRLTFFDTVGILGSSKNRGQAKNLATYTALRMNPRSHPADSFAKRQRPRSGFKRKPV